jgi:hypothetical protein
VNVYRVDFRTIFAVHQEVQPAITAPRDTGEEQPELPAQRMQSAVVINRIIQHRPSRLLKRMEPKGLPVRTERPSDLRGYGITATKSSRQAVIQAAPATSASAARTPSTR